MLLCRSEPELAALLAPHVGGPVIVKFSRSRRVIARVDRQEHDTVVRLHSFFADAPAAVCALLGTWLESGGDPADELGAWIDEQLLRIDSESRSAFVADHVSAVHPLKELFDEVLRAHFDGEFRGAAEPIISWGRRGRTRARKTIRLGSFERERRIIRIHPVLDQRFVPRWFVGFLIFHELLHAAHLKHVLAGEAPHGPTFCARESEHGDCWRASLWLRFNLPALLRSARTGLPLESRGWSQRQHELRFA